MLLRSRRSTTVKPADFGTLSPKPYRDGLRPLKTQALGSKRRSKLHRRQGRKDVQSFLPL